MWEQKLEMKKSKISKKKRISISALFETRMCAFYLCQLLPTDNKKKRKTINRKVLFLLAQFCSKAAMECLKAQHYIQGSVVLTVCHEKSFGVLRKKLQNFRKVLFPKNFKTFNFFRKNNQKFATKNNLELVCRVTYVKVWTILIQESFLSKLW